jgi:putative ABC transport system permease protein
VIALTAAMLVGVIFGTAPATRAAQMVPVEALKYE